MTADVIVILPVTSPVGPDSFHTLSLSLAVFYNDPEGGVSSMIRDINPDTARLLFTHYL